VTDVETYKLVTRLPYFGLRYRCHRNELIKTKLTKPFKKNVEFIKTFPVYFFFAFSILIAALFLKTFFAY
jgi:hypothetical protein